VFFILGIACAMGQPTDAGVPTVRELEEKIRSRRDSITFGTLRIDSASYEFPGSKKLLREQAQRDVWFDTKRTRVSWFGRMELSSEKFSAHVCLPFRSKDDFLIYRSNLPPPSGQRIVISKQSRDDARTHPMFDPRALGLCAAPMRLQHNFTLPGLLGRANYKATVKPTSWDGQKAYEIIHDALEGFNKKTGTRFRMVVVPDMDYSVPESELSATYDGKPYQELLRIDLEQFGKAKRWFPRKLNFKKIRGGEIVEEDNTHIVSADFDTPPPESAFGIRAMNIPAGTPVVIDFDGIPREWNGKDIVEKRRDEKVISQTPDVAPPARANWSSPWLWTAGALSVVGGVCLYGAWRRKAVS
jgi:hypothetical protein